MGDAAKIVQFRAIFRPLEQDVYPEDIRGRWSVFAEDSAARLLSQRPGGLDDGGVAQTLWEIAQHRAIRREFLGEQAELIAQ